MHLWIVIVCREIATRYLQQIVKDKCMHSVSSTKMSKHIADYTQQKPQQSDLFQKTARSEVIWETLLSLGSMKKGSKLNLNQELPSQKFVFLVKSL